MKFLLAITVGFVLAASMAMADGLAAGSRVTIKSEGRPDYTPRIVNCGAESGICLRDTRSEPADKPVVNTVNGQQVNFPSWDIIYLFRDGGVGLVFDISGKQIGTFSWTQ